MPPRILLPDGWGNARLCEIGEHLAPSHNTARSYDHAGRQVVWEPPRAYSGLHIACDIEARGRDSSFLAARFGVAEDDFAAAWVTTEVLAKLANVPIIIWVASHGLVRPPDSGIGDVKLPKAALGHARLLLVKTSNYVVAFGCID